MKRPQVVAWLVGGSLVVTLFMRVLVGSSWGQAIAGGLAVGIIATFAEASRRGRRDT